MLLLERVHDAMYTDATATTEEASESLRYFYLDAPRKEQKVIDQVFIRLCGWSLHYLIYDQEICDLDYRVQCRCD